MRHGYYFEVYPAVRRYLDGGNIHFYYFCGGRGIGKTYSIIDLMYGIGTGRIRFDDDESYREKFIFMRRSQVETEAIAIGERFLFKEYNQKENTNLSIDYNSKTGFGNCYNNIINENGNEIEVCKEHIGFIASLSTFANLRGVVFNEVTCIILDECIPQSKNARIYKDEGFMILNMIESVNRNRILDGKKEIVFIMLSNPIDLGNLMLSQLRLTPIISHMQMRGQKKYTEKRRSLHIEILKDHPVSKDKETGFLYKFAQDTKFNDEALSGDFVSADMSRIDKTLNLSEYKCRIQFENLYIYQHKSLNKWHITETPSTPEMTLTVSQRDRFRKIFYWRYKLLYMENAVTFDNFNTQTIFNDMIKFKPL